MQKDKLLLISLCRHDDPETSTTFEIAAEATASRDLAIVEYPFTLLDLMRQCTSPKGWLRLKATICFWSVITRSRNGVLILIPPIVFPINFLPSGRLYRFIQKLNHRILASVINRFLRRREWNNYIYVNSYNYYYPFLTKYLTGNALKKAYHCVDPIVKNYTRRHGLENERLAVSQSDLVISTAPQLQQKWSKSSISYLIPNGVNYQHFNRLLGIDETIRSLGSVVVGYFGKIERRIDYTLLTKTFRQNPAWQLLMAGPVEAEYLPNELKRLPNVHFTGPYVYENLPDMINSVDVTLIPFQCDESAKAIYPLKLYEYLSVGKPLVCTNFNPAILSKMDEIIYRADPNRTLAQCIESALTENDPHMSMKRRKCASENTWAHRSAQFLRLLRA